jgi:hypothetical protein
MAVMLDTLSRRTNWVIVDDEVAAQIAATDDPAQALFFHVDAMEDAGEPLPIVGDDETDLSLADAMTIAGTYGGGEFDGEIGAVVAALCALRDHIGAVA